MINGVFSVMENALATSAGSPAQTKSAIQPQLDLILAAIHHKCTHLHVQE
jgi:hypothetical protein